MRQSNVCKFLAPVALVIALALPASAQQSATNFAKAITNLSTSPYYVLITVVNDKTGMRRTICTVAPFLLGAIQHQYHILPLRTKHGDQQAEALAWERKLEAAALASKDHVYHFSNPKALKNLQVRYTQQELAQIHAQLSSLSTSEIIAGLSQQSSGLYRIYTKCDDFHEFAANRDALAYVLLERGLQPRQADMTGGLYLAKQQGIYRFIMFKFAEDEAVALIDNYPNLGLTAGAVGIVWAMYTTTPPCYEVTWKDQDGRDFDMTMDEEELAKLESE